MYANISTTSDLLSNDEQMKTDYHTNQPTKIFFDQIKDAIVVAATGDCSYTPV
jgi:hypothetical protein